MRRTIVTAFAALSVAACSPSVQDGQTTPTAPPPSSPAEAVAVMDTATACEIVDVQYTELDRDTQELITQGLRAEAKGDKETVAKTLLALRPVFASTSATFTDMAGQVTDPALRDALASLAAAAAKEAAYDSFADFQALAAMLAPAEATLKEKCAAAGYALKNVQ